jgi:hypothetical protein
MNIRSIPNLGNHILIVMDNCAACLDMIQTVVRSLPDIAERQFTLIHYVPPIYWEHEGDDCHEESKRVWEADQRQFIATADYLKQAQTLLVDGGVPASHVNTVVETDTNDTQDAVLNELRRTTYDGVVLSIRHHGLANLLRGDRSPFNLFIRPEPRLTVWESDVNLI